MLDESDLPPLQLLLLEVYRTHTKYGYPGAAAGQIAHNTQKCRKCAVLERHRAEFEELLPWESIRHLHQMGNRYT